MNIDEEISALEKKLNALYKTKKELTGKFILSAKGAEIYFKAIPRDVSGIALDMDADIIYADFIKTEMELISGHAVPGIIQGNSINVNGIIYPKDLLEKVE